MVLFNIQNSHFIGHMLLDNPALFGHLDTNTDALFSTWKGHKKVIDFFAVRTKISETPKELIALTIIVRAPGLFNHSTHTLKRRILNLL